MKILKGFCDSNETFDQIVKKASRLHACRPFCEKFYELINKKIGNETVGELIKNASTGRNCYFYALMLATAMDGAVLTHGVLHKLDFDFKGMYYEEFDHAWVEKGDLVFDTTSKHVFIKNVYYKLFGVEVRKIFTQEDLRDKNTFLKIGRDAIKNREHLSAQLLKMSEAQEFSVSKENL